MHYLTGTHQNERWRPRWRQNNFNFFSRISERCNNTSHSHTSLLLQLRLQAAPRQLSLSFSFRSIAVLSLFCARILPIDPIAIVSAFERQKFVHPATPINPKCHSVTFAQRHREFISTVIQFRFRSVFSVFSLAAGTGSIGRSVDKSDLIDDLNSHSKFAFFLS